MLVADAMTTTVVSCPIEGSLEDAVGAMLTHDVGSVIVERDGDPTGIITTTDVLAATHEQGKPIAAIEIAEAMSHPLVTVEPAVTVRAAVQRMREEGVKRLAVVEELELLGILTQSDIVRNHSDLLREAISYEERRQRLEDAED